MLVEAVGLECGDEDEGEREEQEGDEGVPHLLGVLHGDYGDEELDEEDCDGLRGEFPCETLEVDEPPAKYGKWSRYEYGEWS